MNKIISIIVPIYNIVLYLDRCVTSLSCQTYPFLEIILINDGSTDGSSELCDEWAKKDKRIKVIHQENKGVSMARNRGLLESSGQYITFVDGDDYIDSEMYSAMIALMEKDMTDAVFCGFFHVDDIIKKEVNPYALSCISAYNAVHDCFCNNGWHLSIWNKVFKRDSLNDDLDNIILFKEDLFIGEDAYWLLQVLNNCKTIACCNKAYYFYVSGRKGSTVSLSFGKNRLSSCINRYKASECCYNFLNCHNNEFKWMALRRAVFSLKDVVHFLYNTEKNDELHSYALLYKTKIYEYIKTKKRSKDIFFILKNLIICYAINLKLPVCFVNYISKKGNQ